VSSSSFAIAGGLCTLLVLMQVRLASLDASQVLISLDAGFDVDFDVGLAAGCLGPTL
jgi:hypothetical protein